jgi:SAM-dependent methyltransferase
MPVAIKRLVSVKQNAELSRIYERRFNPRQREQKEAIWRVLCRHFFQKYIRPADTVLDIGAGYCEFINNVACGRRLIVDLNPDVKKFAAPGAEIYLTGSTNLSPIEEASVDVAFASNFFEHLPTKDDFMQTLGEIRRVLKPGGKLLILQPNIRVLGGQYWDFVDHHIALTDRTLVEALELVDMNVVEVRARFLPYTTKSKLPQSPWLVRVYLLVPPVHLIFGKQAWVVAEKPR